MAIPVKRIGIGFRLTLALALLCLFLPVSAWSSSSPWVTVPAGQVRLIAAEDAVGQQPKTVLGLHFQMQPGWKIYWRMPGDAGYPPRFDWSGSGNLDRIDIQWPAPQRFELAGLQNYGYGGDVVLPLVAHLSLPGQALFTHLAVEFLACEKICVPMQARLDLSLPARPPQPTEFSHRLATALAQIPGDGARFGFAVPEVTASGQGDQSRLWVSIRSQIAFQNPDAFLEPAELGSFGRPTVRLAEQGQLAVLDFTPAPGTVQTALPGQQVRVTLVDGDRSMEQSVTIGSGPPSFVPEQTTTLSPPLVSDSFWVMVAFAVLGGLILNVMPCVLPVLSIKLLSILGHADHEKSSIRWSFVATACGIVFSFFCLAVIAIGLKMAGLAVGWGIQFQQPAFLLIMMLVLLVFAANLWGLFHIRLPAALMNLGSERAAAPTLAGHFLTGALATMLATPCSAPFLGSAVGFALAHGPVDILAIFLALGLGMAAPYWLVALFPSLVHCLPKPGRWMIWMRKAMALSLVGTSLWLASLVLATQSAAPSATILPWDRYSPQRLAAAVADGKVVLVDVTADWCITCKINKATTLHQDPVRSRLLDSDVVLLQADWTRPDPEIAAYLASFGRYGIPFNAVYGPAAVSGIALPELPTQQDIFNALQQAKPSP